MTTTRTRGGRAALTEAQKRELDSAKEAAEKAVGAYREAAGRIGHEIGYGGASAVARHVEWSPAHVATLVSAYKTRHASTAGEGSAVA
ncbi:hypothetical protein [Streptomyces sp. NPDC096030]|uniref:hypothetical protein n=1 Tax=Streptomyces sp. NPDC096030 TaxID=3155423 RepID=UPI00332F9218